MLKKIAIFLLVLAIFTVAAIYVFRAEIKRYGLEILLRSFPIPNVKLAKIDFDETKGTLTLEGVKVKNAPGFSYPNVFEADRITLNIDLIMGAKPRLDIHKMDMTDPIIYVERAKDGKWNLLEMPKTMPSVSFREKGSFEVIEEAYAEDAPAPSQKAIVTAPSKVSIKNGTVYFSDREIDPFSPMKLRITSVNGDLSLFRNAGGETYNSLAFKGSAAVEGDPSQVLNGAMDMNLTAQKPTYNYNINMQNVNIMPLKPYLDRYTPFLVFQGWFNGKTEMNAAEGQTESTYTMELMDIRFAINPAKANVPFLETSVQRLSTYLVTQRGTVMLDFREKGDAEGNIRWGLGPLTKRAISLAVVDTVIDTMQTIQQGGSQPGGGQDIMNKDVQGVIDIFKGIFQE